MKNIVLASHGQLATGMKSFIEMLSGENEHVYALTLCEGGNVLDIVDQVKKLLNEQHDVPLLAITDIPGGSVNTALMQLLNYENFTLLSGMNPMLVLDLVLKDEITQSNIEQAIINGKETMIQIKPELQEAEGEDFFD